MTSKHKIHTKLKLFFTLFLATLMLPAMTAEAGDPKQDTVIIELNNNSKIVIVTKSRADLAGLENYDINQMIKDLNAQLSDSVEYMEISDGKAYVNDDDEVEIKDWKINDDEVRIKLGGVEVDVDPDDVDDWDEDDWEDRKKVTYEADRVDRTSHHFNIDIGLNNWLDDGEFPDANNSPYSVKPFGSWYVGLNSINRTWVGGPMFLEWGLGINWYNWKLEDADYIIEEGSERIEFNQVPNTISGQKSKLTASYINASVVPMFDFSRGRRKITSIESGGVKIKKYSRKGFRFGVGGYAGYRIGSHTKYVFKDGGNKEKDKERDNFYLENFRYGLRAQVGWKGVELFATYDLNEVFSPNRGPLDVDGNNTKLQAVSFGITL
ncbi:hypothetical protein SAMN05421640_2542 [Ekhidna lutea]|uniref:Outer membrane protein beta-barrel domain-containing protein n=2 Tax=Ekhidna lutea TaxID=447679 RepID=A0A239KCD7_EKHLU|nr:hypothetical protein SAMN05421640_2542 [Ekhidna lutea]